MPKFPQDTGPLPMGQVGPIQESQRAAAIPTAESNLTREQLLGGQGPFQSTSESAEAAPSELNPPLGKEPSTGGGLDHAVSPVRSGGAVGSSKPRNSSRILCIVNRKGGVGKTTTTFNLAGTLAQMNKSVLVVDLDPMGSLCRSLGIYPGELTLSDVLIGTGGSLGELVRPTRLPNFFVVPGDPNLRTFEMRHGTSVVYREALASQLSELLQSKPFNFVLIDCPPSLGLLSGNVMTAANEAIVPVDGSTYGMGALMDTLGILRLVRKNVNDRLDIAGLLLNNVNLGTVYDRTVLEVFKRRLRGAMFKSVIPSSPEADESSQLGEPVTRYAPNSWMSKAYVQLANELLSREPNYAS